MFLLDLLIFLSYINLSFLSSVFVICLQCPQDSTSLLSVIKFFPLMNTRLTNISFLINAYRSQNLNPCAIRVSFHNIVQVAYRPIFQGAQRIIIIIQMIALSGSSQYCQYSQQ